MVGFGAMHRLSRYSLVCTAALALILALQLIPHSHFFGDDYIHLATLEGRVRDFGVRPFRLYEFTDGSQERLRRQTEAGPFPWFAHPRMKVRFFRPISSGLIALDHSLFGHRSWGYREVGNHGPTRVRFTFDRDLDDPSLVFLAVRTGTLQRVERPAVGETLRLPSSY